MLFLKKSKIIVVLVFSITFFRPIIFYGRCGRKGITLKHLPLIIQITQEMTIFNNLASLVQLGTEEIKLFLKGLIFVYLV